MTLAKRLISLDYLRIVTAFTIFNAVFLFARNLVAGDSYFNFLIWNLFLGFVPFFVSFVIVANLSRLSNLFLIPASIVWLLFYPNAPYMITDLLHIDKSNTIVLYESVMIFSFAMQSLFFGFYSLKLMRVVFERKIGKRSSQILIDVSILLSSFGIYLGRVLRLNSWDVFTNPLGTFMTILDHLFPVTENPTTYIVIFIFTLIQVLLYLSIRDLKELQKPIFAQRRQL